MFIGVVGKRNEEQGFNGKIFLERIADEKIFAVRKNFCPLTCASFVWVVFEAHSLTKIS